MPALATRLRAIRRGNMTTTRWKISVEVAVFWLVALLKIGDKAGWIEELGKFELGKFFEERHSRLSPKVMDESVSIVC